MAQTFSAIIHNEKPVLVDFYADWCAPCRMMNPILEEVKRTLGDDAIILKVNVDQDPATADTYGITGIPTLMIFKNGEVRWRQAGLISANQIIQQLNDHKN
jgi:thioredoxin 1